MKLSTALAARLGKWLEAIVLTAMVLVYLAAFVIVVATMSLL